jgi:hypothetical protein
MGSELETRRNDKEMLFQLYQNRDKGSINAVIASLQARMEPEDVKLVKQEYDEFKKQQ